MLNCRAISVTLIFLVGCADTNWQRAFYEGQRNTAAQCRLTRRPVNAPCPVLPEYGQYEMERARASGAAVSDASPPTEGAQQ